MLLKDEMYVCNYGPDKKKKNESVVNNMTFGSSPPPLSGGRAKVGIFAWGGGF